jgi:hypothetical protein
VPGWNDQGDELVDYEDLDYYELEEDELEILPAKDGDDRRWGWDLAEVERFCRR